MTQYKGASRQHEIKSSRRRKDTRLFGQRFSEMFNSGDGAVVGLIILFFVGILMLILKIPFGGELVLFLAWLYRRNFVDTHSRFFDFPYRVPLLAKVRDGSTKGGKSLGEGITYLGNDLETKEQIYAGNSDLRTHMLVLGTTGSGKPQPYHANILTPTGWRKMGELNVGDLVCTPDGKQAPIINLYEQGNREIFTVTTKDGRWAQATGDHLWRVLVRKGDGTEVAETLSTDSINELLSRKVRVLIPRVKKRKNGGAKFCSWQRIWKIKSAGIFQCRCIEIDHKDHLYITNNYLVTHNTELLLGIVFNALVQNTGFIYVDGKGDPNLQKQIFRLARILGREDDILIINFITSGRDFVEKQVDKVTNNMNIMGNTSSGMLIELIVSLMDDSGGGGDMWKGRAISFVAALTRPLTYLRDKGYMNLSPEKYLEYFELNVIEELVWEHNGKYGENFDMIAAPLRSYLVTLPGYQKAKMKKQETKTLEQHGYIVMQLTRIFNDLTFNYGHIFKTRVGDVDFFDVVINRRLLVVLLPALERAPDSLRMLGKMIVGSIKQMMAGCLGNRVEGVVREIIDSRPTNAAVPFYTILDEYGYYAVIGFAVAPAQARSLGFCVIFAAQDFSSLKKSSAEEADATWENTNIRAIGRITSGTESETWKRIHGAAAESQEAVLSGFERKTGGLNETFTQQDNVSIERRSRVDYDDFAMQENGEFTFLIGKKEKGGKSGGVRVIRGMGFYTASKGTKDMRVNDFLPIESPEPSDLPQNRKAVESLLKSLVDGSFPMMVNRSLTSNALLSDMARAFNLNHERKDRAKLGKVDVGFAVLGWFLNSDGIPVPAGRSDSGASETTAVLTPNQDDNSVGQLPSANQDNLDLHELGVRKGIMDVCEMVLNEEPKPYASATHVKMADDDDEITISAEAVSTSVIITDEDHDAFREQALPILRQHLYMLDGVSPEDEWIDEINVAEVHKLLELETISSEHGYESMHEKWEAEERIGRLRDDLAR